jgi:integrase/recombinase XerC
VDWTAAADAYGRYLAVEKAYSPRTCEAYGRDIEEFRRIYRERRDREPDPRRLDTLDVRAHLAALFDRNDAASIARKLSALRGFFRFLISRGLLEHNPARAVRSPKRKKALPRALDVDDTFRLIEAPAEDTPLARRDRALVEVLYGAGLRVSEGCGLDLGDLDRGRYGSTLLQVRRGKGGKAAWCRWAPRPTRRSPRIWRCAISSPSRKPGARRIRMRCFSTIAEAGSPRARPSASSAGG